MGRYGDDDEALRRLFVAHYAGMLRLAALLLDDLASCEDVVSEAFAKLHSAQLRDPERALPYLRQSVVNLSRSALRRRVVARRHEPTLARVDVDADPTLAAIERDALRRALLTLQRRQREALVLRYYADLSEAQAAEVMGVSAGSVKAYASRGLAALADQLEHLR